MSNIGKNAVKVNENDKYGGFKLAGQMILLSNVNTVTNHTVSNADTDITTIALAANNYTKVRVFVVGVVGVAAAATAQLINLKIKDGATQEGVSQSVSSIIPAAVTDYIPFSIDSTWVEQSAVTIHITEGAAAADANTTVYVNSIMVFGIV